MNLLILDVDGVMTNGTKFYSPTGEVLGKSFCDHDFTAIKKFQKDGWAVCWLSADKTVNEAIAKDRGIDFWYSRNDDGSIDKVKWLFDLINRYKSTIAETVYVGDDLFDLPVMKLLVNGGGKAFCPANAAPHVKLVATTLLVDGGSGAVMDLYYSHYNQGDSQPCG